jgi:hypothetical protein
MRPDCFRPEHEDCVPAIMFAFESDGSNGCGVVLYRLAQGLERRRWLRPCRGGEISRSAVARSLGVFVTT